MAARVHRGSPEAAAPTPIRYQGLVTRGIAFVLDAALINLVALVVGIAAALILSILSLPESLNPALGALGAFSFVVWTVAYFTLFWASTGQTPGNRVMEIRVVTADGERAQAPPGAVSLRRPGAGRSARSSLASCRSC